MANKDYDELLEAFMNNSQKAYNEDKERHEKSQNLPSSYNTFSKEKSKDKKRENINNAKASVKAKKHKDIGIVGKVLLGMLMVFGVVGVVCASVMLIYGYSFVHGDPVFDLNEEATGQNQTSIIYCYKGDDLVELTRLHGEENRIWLENDEMPDYLSKAVIACEDVRFEKHNGVDWVRTIGVMVKPSNSGQGGSTITQQLIKNLTDENDVTFVRKFNEILSALNIEKHYDKEQIMEAYLNTIYLSHGCYGVKTAAETYFGKDVKDLSVAECACLVAITKFPTRYDPLLNPENNESRRNNYILPTMLKQGYITQEEYDKAIKEEIIFTNSKKYKGSKVKKNGSVSGQSKSVNSYHTDYLIDQVTSDLQKNGYSAKKARKMIFGGGLKIYSSVDLDVQNALEDVYENYRKMPDETVQGAAVVMDYKGRILGMIGGTGKKKQDRILNRAWQSRRQPGSTIKPLSVYGPALEKSLNDDSVDIYWSTPTPDKPLTRIDGKPWPTNEGGGYSGGNVTVQRGLAKSMNTISAQTLDKIGVNYSYDFLVNRFHISTLETLDCDYAPMATGSMTHGVSVLDMTTAYQAFGNGGYYYEGYSYFKIEDSKGNVIIEKNPEANKEVALSTNTAWLMNKILQTVMTEGTGTSYKISNVQCFGKTGTTTGSYDRWFMGGTPEYVCGVWYGYDKNKEVVYRLSYNPAGTLWNEVMKRIYDKKGKNVKEFPECEGLVHREYAANGKLCKGSGKWGWFDENNLPGTTSDPGWTSSTKKDDKSTTKKNENSDSESTTSAETTEATTASSDATEAQTESNSED